MATVQDILSRLQTEDGGFWSWLQDHPNALTKVKNLAQEYAGGEVGALAQQRWDRFFSALTALPSYGSYLSGVTVDEPPPADEGQPGEDLFNAIPPAPAPGAVYNGDGTWTLPNGAVITQTGSLVGNPDILATLQGFLTENGLPASLITFLRAGLEQSKPYAQIIAELRETPEYKAAYPENDLRAGRGLSWMPEAEIRATRDEVRRLAFDYWGVEVSNGDIANLIGRGTSVRQWEHALQIYDMVERLGPYVQSVFEGYRGVPLSEQQLYAFLDPEFATPDLDRDFALAKMRGTPGEFGFGVRPEEEVLALERIGIDPNRVIENYRTIATELPRFQRLAAIGQYLETNGQDFFGDISVSGSLLFRAVNFGDPAAMLELQRRGAEEAARYRAGGAPTRSRTGAATGLAVPGA